MGSRLAFDQPAASLKGSSLSQRVEKLQEILAEREQLVEEGCQVLRAAGDSLKVVKGKFEPVKTHSSLLSNTSKNVTQCNTEVSRLLICVKVHEKLDKAINRPGGDRNEELMNGMRETLDANAFLTKLDHLPMAVMALNRNRESLARATATCSNRFDRVLKAHAAVPSAAVVEELLAAPPKDRPDSVTIFFGSRKGDVKTLSEIMGIMLRAEDHTCLTSYIKARQQTVAGMMKAAAAGAGGVVPAAAQQQRKVQEWTHQMMMVAQLLHWEAELAHEVVPAGAVPRTLNAIVSTTVTSVVDAGYALASGRASPERLFPLLDGIVCMHDPFVQPIMKQAFKVEALKPLKEKFHDLLAHLNLQARHCVESFSGAIVNNPAPLKKDGGANTTVAQQTAFVMRFLKSLFRKEVIGKLPFLENPQKLAVESISAMMRDLEQKLNVATRDPAAVSLGMMNNLRFILAAVSEHDQLPTLLGSAWVAHQEKKLANFKAEYFQSTWAPLVDAVAAGTAEAANAKKDIVKEHCRRINARIEKIFTIQCYFVLPDATLKSEMFRQLSDEVLQPYTRFWRTYESMQLLKTPAKHFRHSPDDLKMMIDTCLFTGSPMKPGYFKK